MSTLTDCREVLEAAAVVVAAVKAGDYTTVAAYEGDANAVRSGLRDVLAALDAENSVEHLALRTTLVAVAARLIDLRDAVSDALATITVTTDRVTSAIELAVDAYADWSRWTEIADLNPRIPDLASIPANTDVVRYVR